jgi:hypothetical protein
MSQEGQNTRQINNLQNQPNRSIELPQRKLLIRQSQGSGNDYLGKQALTTWQPLATVEERMHASNK